jgi:hypothetical protein
MEVSALAGQSRIFTGFGQGLANDVSSPSLFCSIFIAGGTPGSDWALRLSGLLVGRFRTTRIGTLTGQPREARLLLFGQLYVCETGMTDCQEQVARLPGSLALV